MFGYFEWQMQACIISPTTIIKMRSVSSWFLINGLKIALCKIIRIPLDMEEEKMNFRRNEHGKK